MTPKKTKLNKKDLEYFHNSLVKLRARITGELGEMKGEFLGKNIQDSSGDLSENTFHKADMSDMASDMYETELNLGLFSNEQDLLLEIDDALQRIKEGTYGICEKYEVPIPKERLKVVPWTRYSIKAQEEEDKEKKERRNR